MKKYLVALIVANLRKKDFQVMRVGLFALANVVALSLKEAKLGIVAVIVAIYLLNQFVPVTLKFKLKIVNYTAMENENKLPPDFKAKWVEALRSGEYKQCQFSLVVTGGGYCCIGVAGKVYGLSDDEIRTDGYHKLPDAIRGGFSNPTASHLIAMNDDYKKTFSEIADYIEQNL